MLVVGAGFDARQRKLGHFAADRWQHARNEGALPEVLIGGEGLERGPEPVFATLLHEAAHALAEARNVQDTSRQGRYHNQHFKAIAEELGLAVARAPGIGWSATTLPAATAALYRATIEHRHRGLPAVRRVASLESAQTPSLVETVAATVSFDPTQGGSVGPTPCAVASKGAAAWRTAVRTTTECRVAWNVMKEGLPGAD
jgi:hypothetical protein